MSMDPRIKLREPVILFKHLGASDLAVPTLSHTKTVRVRTLEKTFKILLTLTLTLALTLTPRLGPSQYITEIQNRGCTLQ